MVSAETARITGGTIASTAGAMGGILLGEHDGVPILMMLIAIGLAICFGLISSTERERDDREKRFLRRMAVANFGTLWMLACATVFLLGLGLASAIVLGLSLGLFGSHALERLESSAFFNDIATRIAKWWLERAGK